MSDAPAPGAQVRALIRRADRATLATTQAADGWPYGSLVLAACDHDAAPLLLLSDLADHTKNIAEDGRVSLLYDGTAGLDDPLTGARATVLGRAAKTDDPRLRARYLARHPSAEMYADFGDFNSYRVEIERAHLVAGFGHIHWVDGGEVVGAAPSALAASEPDIVDHMNADHADAVALYAAMLGHNGGDWRLTGVDPEGADLRRAGAVARLDFEKPVTDAESARVELVRLVKQARAA